MTPKKMSEFRERVDMAYEQARQTANACAKMGQTNMEAFQRGLSTMAAWVLSQLPAPATPPPRKRRAK